MAELLLVEDDPAIVRSLCDYLSGEGMEVRAVSGQKAAAEELENRRYDLLLVDVSLSDGDGFSVCSLAREKNRPVIFLTASGTESSVVQGFDCGADDYVAKPFRPRELVSRINNVLRRYAGNRSVVSLGPVTVDTEKGTVEKNGREIVLSALEYRILILFLNHRGKLLTRNQLLEDIWDAAGDFVNDNTLTVYIKRLREKIEDDPQNPTLIKTVRGLGYRVD